MKKLIGTILTLSLLLRVLSGYTVKASDNEVKNTETIQTTSYQLDYVNFLNAIIAGGEKNQKYLEDKIVLSVDEYGYITDLDSFALEDINKDGVPELYLKSKRNSNYGDLYTYVNSK